MEMHNFDKVASVPETPAVQVGEIVRDEQTERALYRLAEMDCQVEQLLSESEFFFNNATKRSAFAEPLINVHRCLYAFQYAVGHALIVSPDALEVSLREFDAVVEEYKRALHAC